jgi:hypothetical protein
MSGPHRLLCGLLAGGGREVRTLLPPPESSLLDARSPYSGTVNFDTEVRAREASHANAILSAAAATLPPPAHRTSIRESTYGISTDTGAFALRTVSDAEWMWLRNLQTYAACAGRDLLFEILPDFVEARTRDAGPTPDALSRRWRAAPQRA